MHPNMKRGAIRLLVLNGPRAGRTFPINGQRLRIGRNDPPAVTVDIDLTSCELGSPAMVSRMHAELIAFDGQIHIVDLGSRNGTWVDDIQLVPGPTGASEPIPIGPGRKIRLANVEFEVVRSTDPIDLVDAE
jgi:pSer/pThr/pTyr-binding forkhead associated (FHA) protein